MTEIMGCYTKYKGIELLKSILKWLKYAIISIAGMTALYFLMAWILTIIPTNSDFEETPDGIEVYLVSNGMHVDVCLPKSELQPLLKSESFTMDDDKVQYYSLGWGDQGFYIYTPSWDDLKISTALYAMFWPSPTAMHVSYRYDTPVPGEKVKKVLISREQLQSMAMFIDESFQTDNSGHYISIPVENDYYPMVDEFFEAKGNYFMLYTCNVWSNECIKAGGIKTATWAPFEWCILYHFE